MMRSFFCERESECGVCSRFSRALSCVTITSLNCQAIVSVGGFSTAQIDDCSRVLLSSLRQSRLSWECGGSQYRWWGDRPAEYQGLTREGGLEGQEDRRRRGGS